MNVGDNHTDMERPCTLPSLHIAHDLMVHETWDEVLGFFLLLLNK